jgi:catechol 2,3-dioxygenase-like lactoylglutathione lyase family enzyme
MFDHVGITVRDFERSKAFYQVALAPLGYKLQMEFTGAAGFGREGMPAFWIGGRPDFWTEEHQVGHAPVHLAFRASDRAAVGAFHAAALVAGGRDNGGPGLRAHYHPTYYGAFIIDPDGNNVEAVCHRPEA